MKTSRLLLPLLALFATGTLFANEIVAKVTLLNGTANAVIGETRTQLRDADSLEDNTLIEVKGNSVLGFKYTRGEALYFEGPARFRLHAPKDGAPAVVDLLRGKVSADAGNGAVDIRTGAGTASVGKGNLASFDYMPAMTTGTLAAYALNGDLPVSALKTDSVIPSGKMGVFGPDNPGDTRPIGANYGDILSHAKGIFDTPAIPTVPMPDVSKLNPPGLAVMSPNGEGAYN